MSILYTVYKTTEELKFEVIFRMSVKIIFFADHCQFFDVWSR